MCKISKNVLKCISGLDCLYDFKEWREKMRFVIQRVNNAKVTVDGNVTGSIGKGVLIFFGAGQNDTEDMLEKFKDKIVKLRIFADEDGKTNLSVKDVDGEVLIVSQFTLYADEILKKFDSIQSASVNDKEVEVMSNANVEELKKVYDILKEYSDGERNGNHRTNDEQYAQKTIKFEKSRE